MEELNNLNVGDKRIVIRGHDAGRECEVAFIEGESALVRSAYGRRFNSLGQYARYARLKPTSYRELKLE